MPRYVVSDGLTIPLRRLDSMIEMIASSGTITANSSSQVVISIGDGTLTFTGSGLTASGGQLTGGSLGGMTFQNTSDNYTVQLTQLNTSVAAIQNVIAAEATNATSVETWIRERPWTIDSNNSVHRVPFAATSVDGESLRFNGNDNVTLGSANDNFWGAAGNDTINGAGGNDVLAGAAGEDFIQGGSGNDLIRGGANDDTIQGNSGDDFIIAGDGNDIVTGDSGADKLLGGNGNDVMNGGTGDDVLAGADGVDQLITTSGNDKMLGGGGIDTFSFFEDTGAARRAVVFDLDVNNEAVFVDATSTVSLVDVNNGVNVVMGDDTLFVRGVSTATFGEDQGNLFLV